MLRVIEVIVTEEFARRIKRVERHWGYGPKEARFRMMTLGLEMTEATYGLDAEPLPPLELPTDGR